MCVRLQIMERITENIEIEPVWKDCGEDKHADTDKDNHCDECGYIMVKEVKPEETTASSGKTTTDTGHEDEKTPKDHSDAPGWMILMISCFGGIIAVCGIVLAVVCFGKIWLVDHMMLGNENITLMVDLVVCLALAVTVVLAKMVGCMLPMAAKAVKLDPAVMASPFISTIVDALSLLVYFLFAKMLLGV
mgnify:CR=1 FL=1